MIETDFRTVSNLAMGVLAIVTAIVILYRGGWSFTKNWIGVGVALTLINAGARSIYYLGTMFAGWNRQSHGDVIATINPVAFIADAILLIIILNLVIEIADLKQSKKILLEKFNDYKARIN